MEVPGQLPSLPSPLNPALVCPYFRHQEQELFIEPVINRYCGTFLCCAVSPQISHSSSLFVVLLNFVINFLFLSLKVARQNLALSSLIKMFKKTFVVVCVGAYEYRPTCTTSTDA